MESFKHLGAGSRPNSGRLATGSGSTENSRPVSPTDELLSPVSKQMRGLKKIGSAADMKRREKRRIHINLHKEIPPLPFPPNSIDFILGTSSSSRREVIDVLRWKYTQMSPDIDEKAIRTPDPMELPLLIAKAKASALVERLQRENCLEEKVIVTADQIVLFEGQIREKPESVEEAKLYLRSYSGRSVSTVSAVVVTHFPSQSQRSGIDIATVIWDIIPENVVESVVARGEVMSSAGGFRIEDPELNPLLIDIDGTLDSVFGMPVKITFELLSDLMQDISQVDADI